MVQSSISQLAHLELVTPRPQESLDFMTRVLSLEESGRDGQSVYLRCWGDHFHHSIVLTEGPEPAMAHAGWRAAGPEQLQAAADRLEASGAGEGWHEGGPGHGPAYRYRTPGGHQHELFWEVERFVAADDKRSTFPSRPQRPQTAGVGLRQLDHVTMATQDPWRDATWCRDNLGYRIMEYTGLDARPDFIVFAMITTNEKGHDLGFAHDLSERRGRLHHLAFWVDSVEDVMRAADTVMEAGYQIEFGPGKHGVGEQVYLYFRDPGSGIRVEVNSGGYRNYQPDWEPVKWLPSQGSMMFYRNLVLPPTMMEAFPPDDAMALPEPELAGLENPYGRQALEVAQRG